MHSFDAIYGDFPDHVHRRTPPSPPKISRRRIALLIGIGIVLSLGLLAATVGAALYAARSINEPGSATGGLVVQGDEPGLTVACHLAPRPEH